MLLLVKTGGMAITSDTGVLLASAAVLAGVLAYEHVAMLADAMAFVLWDVMVAVMGRCLGGCPSEVISSDLDIVVGKFAQLVVIHTQQFGFLGSAKMKAWNKVDGVGNDEGHDEGIAGASNDVSNLDVELFIVLVNEATSDDAGVDTIQADDVGCAKESISNKTKNACDTVLSEHIHRVIDSEPVFHWRVSQHTALHSGNMGICTYLWWRNCKRYQ